jgi:prepilin-type N-terminal cleavage/methylation domain-containing protein
MLARRTGLRRNRLTVGFTLIELLVVLSIITLLIALLLPALASARLTAESIKCASGMRQVGMAFTMYAEDNNQTTRGWGTLWTRNMTDYFGTNSKATATEMTKCPSNPNTNDAWSFVLQRSIRYYVKFYSPPYFNEHIIGSDTHTTGGSPGRIVVDTTFTTGQLWRGHPNGAANMLIGDMHVMSLTEDQTPVYRDQVALGGFRSPGYYRLWGENSFDQTP